MSTAITKAKEISDAKVGGIFSMLKPMRDPNRQVAMGYFMNIAKALLSTAMDILKSSVDKV